MTHVRVHMWSPYHERMPRRIGANVHQVVDCVVPALAGTIIVARVFLRPPRSGKRGMPYRSR